MAEPIGSLRAEISATAAKFSEDMAKIQARLSETNASFNRFANQVSASGKQTADKLDKAWAKLSSGTEILTSVMKKLGNVISGFVWGAIIAGVSIVITKFTEWIKFTNAVAVSQKTLTDALGSKIGVIDQLINSTKNLTQAEFNLLQLELTRRREAEQERKDTLTKLIEELGTQIKYQEKLLEQSKNTIIGSQLENQQIISLFKSKQALEQANAELAVSQEKLDRLWKISKKDLTEFNAAIDDLGKKEKKVADGFINIRENLNFETPQLDPFQEMVANFPDTIKGLVPGLKANFDTMAEVRNRFSLRMLELDKLEMESAELKAKFLSDLIQREVEAQAFFAEQRLAIQANYASAVGTVLEGIYQASGGRSKVLFALVKAAAIAEGIVRTNLAYLQVLSTPPGPLYMLPLAESVRAMGYAAVAAMAATSIGSMAIGGGGGGGGGGIRAISPNLTTEKPEEQPPLEIVFNITAGAVDERTLDLLGNQMVDKLGSILGDRNGRAGNYQVQMRRL